MFVGCRRPLCCQVGEKDLHTGLLDKQIRATIQGHSLLHPHFCIYTFLNQQHTIWFQSLNLFFHCFLTRTQTHTHFTNNSVCNNFDRQHLVVVLGGFTSCCSTSNVACNVCFTHIHDDGGGNGDDDDDGDDVFYVFLSCDKRKTLNNCPNNRSCFHFLHFIIISLILITNSVPILSSLSLSCLLIFHFIFGFQQPANPVQVISSSSLPFLLFPFLFSSFLFFFLLLSLRSSLFLATFFGQLKSNFTIFHFYSLHGTHAYKLSHEAIHLPAPVANSNTTFFIAERSFELLFIFVVVAVLVLLLLLLLRLSSSFVASFACSSARQEKPRL